MNAEPEVSPEGELTQVICSFLDVTEGAAPRRRSSTSRTTTR